MSAKNTAMEVLQRETQGDCKLTGDQLTDDQKASKICPFKRMRVRGSTDAMQIIFGLLGDDRDERPAKDALQRQHADTRCGSSSDDVEGACWFALTGLLR